MTNTKKGGRFARQKGGIGGLLLAGTLLTAAILALMLLYVGGGSQNQASRMAAPDIAGKFDQYSTNLSSSALDGVIDIARVYRLDDKDLIAPVPDQNAFGTADDPAQLAPIIGKAGPVLAGQNLYFDTATTQIHPGSHIEYYLDDSILMITWKETVDNTVYSFSEVKIAHGSQLRRFLAGGEFGSDKRFPTTDMAQSVNAVVASSGDFYKFRYNGVVVYENTVRRVNTNKADTCYITEDGDLLFTYQNASFTNEEAQKFVDDNRIRFSLTFGPVLVDNGVRCEPKDYELGEVNEFCSRAAICQMDKLHYLLVTANVEDGYPEQITIHKFAERIEKTGCMKGYALDGGQTAAIAVNGKLFNHVLFGQQRPISDIIYFATAIPNGG